MAFAFLLDFMCENFFETVIAVVLFFKNKHEHWCTVSTVKDSSGKAEEENDDIAIYVNHDYLPKIDKIYDIHESKIFKKEYLINGYSFSEESFVDRNIFKEFQITEDDNKFSIESVDGNGIDESKDDSINQTKYYSFVERVEDAFPQKTLDVTIQETPYGLIINSNVLVPVNNWHSIVTEENRTECIVCDLSVSMPTDHIKFEAHNRNLDNCKPLKKYDSALTRRIRNSYHCIICNVIFKFQNIDTHFDSKYHEENMLYAINRAVDVLECNLKNDKYIDFNNSDENSKVIDTRDEYVSINYESNIHPEDNSYALPVRDNFNDTKPEITEDSRHMILVPNESKFYCMACTSSYDLTDKTLHYTDRYHLKKLNECKVIERYGEFFVREVGDRYYHCGVCNSLQYPYNIETHMELVHHVVLSETDHDELQGYINNKNRSNSSDQDRYTYNANMNHESNESRSSSSNYYPESNESPSCSSAHLHESNDDRRSPSLLCKEYVYLNQFNQILRVSYMSYHFVIRREDDYLCWLCNFSSNEFKMILHTSERSHLGKLIYMHFVPDFGNNLIRVINSIAHCGICNTCLYVSVLHEHIQHDLHIRLLTAAIIKSPNYMDNVPNQSHLNQLTFGLPSNATRTNANINEQSVNQSYLDVNARSKNLTDTDLKESDKNFTNNGANESSANLTNVYVKETSENLEPGLNESGENLSNNDPNEWSSYLTNNYDEESSLYLTDSELNESGENLTDPELNESSENLTDNDSNELNLNRTNNYEKESSENLINSELNESGENLTNNDANDTSSNLTYNYDKESSEILIDPELNELGKNLTGPEFNESGRNLTDPELNESDENLTNNDANDTSSNLTYNYEKESSKNLIDPELNESGENLTGPELNESGRNLTDSELNESGENLTNNDSNESNLKRTNNYEKESSENLIDFQLNESGENLTDVQLNESGKNLTDPELNESGENLTDPELNESGENLTDPELNESGENLTMNDANESSANQTNNYVKESSENLTDPELNKSGENLMNNNANESSPKVTNPDMKESSKNLIETDLNDDHESYENPTNIDIKESGENQTILEPYNFDCIYLKVKDTYVKVSYKSYNGLVFVGDGTHYCFLCSLRLYNSYQEHIGDENHLIHLKKSHFIDKNIKHLLRQSSTAYHCVNCNILFLKSELETHMKWSGCILKSDKKTRKSDFKSGIKHVNIKTAQESSMLDIPSEMTVVIKIDVKNSRGDFEIIKSDKIVVFDDKLVKIPWDSWHGLTKNKKGYYCALCQVNLKESVVNMHIAEGKHATILQNSIEKKFLPSIIRTINESDMHCLTCNVAVLNRNNAFSEHLQGKKHDRNLSAINKVDVNNVSPRNILYL